METEVLAIVRNPRVSIEDHSLKTCLFFDAFTREGFCALQIVALPELPEIPGIKWDVSALDGKPCWVTSRPDDNILLFSRWWKEE